MATKDLGTKYVCFKCGARFYDLKKPEPLCPKCGADQRKSPAVKPPPAEKRARAPKPAPVVEEAEAEADLDEEVEADEAEDADDE